MAIETDTQIDQWVEAHQEDLLAFFSHLVQVSSEVCPPTGSELTCQSLVADTYHAAGAQVDMFSPEDVPGLKDHPGYNGMWDGIPRNLQNRPVVVGKFPGSGGGKSILFSTHVDTVPAGAPETWKIAGPFSGAVIDGRLYGRGSWDTKWGIAVSLFAVRCVRELGNPLSWGRDY